MNPAEGRCRDLPAWLLLGLALAVASQRLVATGWTEDLGITFLLVLAGLGLGLALGVSRFRGGLVFLLTLLYGLVLVPFLAAGLLYPAVPWLERMASMGGRIAHSLAVIAAGVPLEDAFLFLAFFAVTFWSLGAASGFALARHGRFGGAILPGGIALVLLQIFDARGDQSVFFMALFLFLALLLMGRLHYARRQETWHTWRLFAAGEARANINLTTLAIAFLLVLTAWLMPVSSRPVPVLRQWWQDISDLWEDNDSLDNVIAGLDTEPAEPVNEFYGRNLALGTEAFLSNAVYFRIQTTGVGGQERYYWRVRSYDVYENGEWGTGTVLERNFGPRDRSLQLPERLGLSAEFTFKVIDTTAGVLVTPARPTWVSRPVRLTYLPAGEESLEPLLFRPSEAIQPGEEYIVHAVLLEPTVKDLRLSGTEYPAWVSERYLQLPADLPPAIAELALEITGEAETPYDKAAAVTSYLRREIDYATSVPPAPAGRDTLAWFLFDYKQGFCNYYATAEVLMLRAAGVPARLVVGFAEGEYESPGWYTVRQRDAHAWPEVYFPGIGWVEFEPTTSEAELIRPSGEQALPGDGETTPLTPQLEVTPDLPVEAEGTPAPAGAGVESNTGGNSLVMLLVFFAVFILVGSALAWAYISGTMERAAGRLRQVFHAPLPILARDWLALNALPVPAWLERQAWHAGLSQVGRSFMTVYRLLRRLKFPATAALTPAEAAAALSACLPQGVQETAALLQEYQSAVYFTRQPDLERARHAARSLRRMLRAVKRSRPA